MHLNELNTYLSQRVVRYQMSRLIHIVIMHLNYRMAAFRFADGTLLSTASNTILSAAQPTGIRTDVPFVRVRFVALVEFVQKRFLIRYRHVDIAGQTASLSLPRRHR